MYTNRSLSPKPTSPIFGQTSPSQPPILKIVITKASVYINMDLLVYSSGSPQALCHLHGTLAVPSTCSVAGQEQGKYLTYKTYCYVRTNGTSFGLIYSGKRALVDVPTVRYTL
jgi:hypothetical protein